jgi:5-methylcytosine-specific restriction endonuclease McrBC regulatory subunit McrC
LDLVVDDSIIIDGKYKSPPSSLSKITMADRDQMFAYSHLQTTKPEKIVLAYPKYELDEERPHDVSLVGKPAQRGGSDGNCELIAVLIPFPTPATLSASHRWNDWRASVGADLQEHIMSQPLLNEGED